MWCFLLTNYNDDNDNDDDDDDSDYDHVDLFTCILWAFEWQKCFDLSWHLEVKVINYIKFEDKFLKNCTK